MKIIELKSLLRTAVLTTSLAAIMGVSACSNEKEDANTQSGDAMGTTQGSEVEDTASREGTLSSSNDTSMDTAADSSDGTDMTNQSGSTDSMGNDELDDHTEENPNLDQTAAEGLQ